MQIYQGRCVSQQGLSLAIGLIIMMSHILYPWLHNRESYLHYPGWSHTESSPRVPLFIASFHPWNGVYWKPLIVALDHVDILGREKIEEFDSYRDCHPCILTNREMVQVSIKLLDVWKWTISVV